MAAETAAAALQREAPSPSPADPSAPEASPQGPDRVSEAAPQGDGAGGGGLLPLREQVLQGRRRVRRLPPPRASAAAAATPAAAAAALVVIRARLPAALPAGRGSREQQVRRPLRGPPRGRRARPTSRILLLLVFLLLLFFLVSPLPILLRVRRWLRRLQARGWRRCPTLHQLRPVGGRVPPEDGTVFQTSGQAMTATGDHTNQQMLYYNYYSHRCKKKNNKIKS